MVQEVHQVMSECPVLGSGTIGIHAIVSLCGAVAVKLQV